MSLPSKTIDELVSLYVLEPSIKDIYVEGETDKALLSWFLIRNNRNDINIYSIDVVDVPHHLLAHYALTPRSNRSKIIAFSYELSKIHGLRASVLCVADRDYDVYLSNVSTNKFLTFTDFNCIESYLIDNSVFDKFVSIVIGGLSCDSELMMRAAIKVLRGLFFIRTANEMLKWNMEWIPIKRYITVHRDLIEFDEARFIAAYLLKNRRSADKDVFCAKIAECKARAPKDVRFVIRGHDLIELLHLIFSKLKRRRCFGDAEYFGGSYMGCLEPSDLGRHPLFKFILSM